MNEKDKSKASAKSSIQHSALSLNNPLIIYHGVDGKIKIETHFDNETVWLTIEQISSLFQRERSVISKHIRNIFKEGELSEEMAYANFAQTTQHGVHFRKWVYS